MLLWENGNLIGGILQLHALLSFLLRHGVFEPPALWSVYEFICGLEPAVIPVDFLQSTGLRDYCVTSRHWCREIRFRKQVKMHHNTLKFLLTE